MTIATTLRHAHPAAGRVSPGYAPMATWDAGAWNGAAGKWSAMPSSAPAHVAFHGAN